MHLRHYLDQGLTREAIAKRLGISSRTIRRWIRAGELDRPIEELARARPRKRKAMKIDPFIDIIRTRLRAYPELTSVRILEEIRAAGYRGCYTRVADLVSRLRPHPVSIGPPVRFETPAGYQAQVDFAEFKFCWGRRYALIVVMGYSRLIWIRFYPNQNMATLQSGLEEAFRYFGGVPQEILFDQMRAVVTGDLRMMGRELILNEEFLRFALYWGFRPRACRKYRAQTKGKVERPIRYLRSNLVYGREFINDEHLAEETSRWLEKANARIHATVKEVPRERFERDERMLLRPVQSKPYISLVITPLTKSERFEQDERKALQTKAIEQKIFPVEKRPLSFYALVEGGVV